MAPPQTKRLLPAPSVPAATASHTPRSSDQKSGGIGQKPAIAGGRRPRPARRAASTSARSQPLVTRPSESANAKIWAALARRAHGGQQVLNLLRGVRRRRRAPAPRVRARAARRAGYRRPSAPPRSTRSRDNRATASAARFSRKPFVVALHRNDHRGGRQVLRRARPGGAPRSRRACARRAARARPAAAPGPRRTSRG